jgi:hypothetical protein
MTYNLRNGYRVITRKVDAGTEFETRNGQNETISSVTLGFTEARELTLSLLRRCA